MSDVNLGNISIPVIAPQRGVDYWTEEDKQEVITEAVNSVNAIVVPQEESRQSNEATRVLNEEGRVNAEATRQSNEQIRINNENTRQSNEDTRQLNEQARINAETVRQSNEETRQTNETNRTNTFNEQMNSIDRAIEGVLKGVTVTPTEPTGNNKSLVWFQKGTNIENKIHVKNDNDEYEIFANTGAFEKEITDARSTFSSLDDRLDNIKEEIDDVKGEVTNARGSFSSLDDRLDDIETEIAEDTITGEGENITLNGTAQNAMKIVIKGKTEQEQLTGKNLINVTDKTITATGYDQYILSNFELDNTKSYVLSLDYSKNNPTFSSEGALVHTKRDNSYVPLIITTDAEGKKTAVITNTSSLSIYVTNRLTGGTIYLKNIMLELGSTATSYEPYCRTEFQALIQIFRRLYIMLVGI